jgi:hypothetical protein
VVDPNNESKRCTTKKRLKKDFEAFNSDNACLSNTSSDCRSEVSIKNKKIKNNVFSSTEESSLGSEYNSNFSSSTPGNLESNFSNESSNENLLQSSEDETLNFYYLKLSNNNENSCFANSIIQMLLTCKKTFFDSIKTKCKSQFCKGFKKYLNFFETKTKRQISSLLLRDIGNIDNKDLQDNYTNGTEQDCFGFLLHLFSMACERVKKNFRLNYTEKYICSQCKTESCKNTHSSFYISLSRNINIKEIEFAKLFKNSVNDNFKCGKCGCYKHIIKNEYKLLGNFLIIRISNEDNNNRLNTQIKNINLDNKNLQFPNVEGFFHCKSAIVHIPNSTIKSKSGGHYKCYSRIEDPKETNFNWLEISDTVSKPQISLPEELKGVYLLMFEKNQ